MSRVRTEKDITEKKVAKVDRLRYKYEEEVGDCRVNCRNLESEVLSLKRELQVVRAARDYVQREKETLVKSQSQLQEAVRKYNSEFQIYQHTRNRMESEMAETYFELESMKKLLAATEKDRDRYSYEAQKISEKVRFSNNFTKKKKETQFHNFLNSWRIVWTMGG